ncbi:hypothetical protein QBC41DRAFT_216877 [Cercophora samala]|uniref:Uncharacterized protein n=1 Tax=Cercophora samala TaxID=330535 RepID=A0AA39ZK98_9PEZI|nr:hypothetical protein QBC41DRAFT_216877 [Cercophora samala]
MSEPLSSDPVTEGLLKSLPVPVLPHIVSEWAAIIPLVCHLANERDDYTTAGKVALAGSLSVGYFPRLGSLSGIARLLNNPGKFSDHANSRGGTSLNVWDVLWGGSFPCGNGAAVDSILKVCDQRSGQSNIMDMPDVVRPKVGPGSHPPHQATISGNSPMPAANSPQFRRYQTLHVYNCKHIGEDRKPKRTRSKRIPPTIRLIVASGLVALLVIIGAYGTAAVLFCTTFSNAVASFLLTVHRPPGYLQNNESTMESGFMLAAAHQNASEWYLFTGDRGVVDSLLNKPMFWIPESKTAYWVGQWFKAANFLQLIAMTFTAGQKSWDGVCLIILLATNWLLDVIANSDASLARQWMKRERVSIEAKTFRFSGRSVMLGAIQLWSKSSTSSWMDDIMAPHPRREAWLKCLEHGERPDEEVWTSGDISRIQLTAGLSAKAAGILQAEFPKIIRKEV